MNLAFSSSTNVLSVEANAKMSTEAFEKGLSPLLLMDIGNFYQLSPTQGYRIKDCPKRALLLCKLDKSLFDLSLLSGVPVKSI